MKLANVTRLARSADPKYPTVRHAMIGSSLAGVAAVAYDFFVNDSFDLLDPIAVAIAAFLGWAIARELDPDHPDTALWALAVATPMAIWIQPALLLSAAVLAALRMIVGTVGGRPTLLDFLVMLGLAGYAASSPTGWPVVAMVVVGILISGGGAFWALGAAGLGVAGSLILSAPPDATFDAVWVPASLFAIAVMLFLFARPIAVSSTTDIGHVPLSPRRVQIGRIVSALVLVAAVLLSGVYGLGTLGPLAGAVAATSMTMAFGGLRAAEIKTSTPRS